METDPDASAAHEDNPLLDALLDASTSFRVGRQAQGDAALVEFVDLLQQALNGLQDEEIAEVVLPHIKEVIAAQERGDYLRVADILEFELQPMV